MIQPPVLPESLAGDATFAILSAGQAPGPAVAKRAADLGAEVVARKFPAGREDEWVVPAAEPRGHRSNAR